MATRPTGKSVKKSLAGEVTASLISGNDKGFDFGNSTKKQVALRLDQTTIEEIKRVASSLGLTVNSYITMVVKEDINKRK